VDCCTAAAVLVCAFHPNAQGKDAVSFLEGLVTGDIAGLADGTGSLSVFTNEKGGIIDDTVITKVALGGKLCGCLYMCGCGTSQSLCDLRDS
jgi:glycine cleavage system aminomethyltransferase T